MLNHRGFSAWIMSNGEALPEYLVAVDENAHRVSCWIPGKEGQAFTVYWQDHGGKVETCSFITLDGLVVPGRFLSGDGVASRGGIRASTLTERPFIFQKAAEDIVESPARGSAKDAGMITVKIKRIKRVDARPANHVQPIPSVLGKRKVGDLCVGFGPEVNADVQHPTTWEVRPHDEDVTTPGATKPSTYVSFVFRYRSPEFLEAQGIAIEEEKPKLPSPIRPTRQSVRRIASLPPHIRDQTESLVEPPAKKPRLLPQALCHASCIQFPTGARRPSAELRRTASWTVTESKSTIDGSDGSYAGESQFFLPRTKQYYAAPLTTIRPHASGSSGTSESPDTSATEDSK